MHSLVIENDVPIALRDGATIYPNVFRPADHARVPVIITLGPCPKDVPFREWNPAAWDRLDVRASDDPR
ncbi:MAG TPA: hypothetical protein VF516_01920 [Kofleriaceae bacterium]